MVVAVVSEESGDGGGWRAGGRKGCMWRPLWQRGVSEEAEAVLAVGSGTLG